MTETELRQKIVQQAKSWIGRKEADGTHRVIIDVYNSIDPLPRNYRMTYSDPWCAAFVSACAQVWGLTDIVFPECACDPMIAKYRAAGRWMEDDAYTPQPGDVIFYDWQDNGYGDNVGSSDHVGIVINVSGRVINIIEGNCSDAVMYTSRQVDGRYIRGYGLPDYASKAAGNEDAIVIPAQPETPTAPAQDDQPEKIYTVELPLLMIGDKGGYVKAAQTLLIARGYDCGNKPLIGVEKADGEFGTKTEKAVGFFQSKNGLEVDGEIGGATWAALLKF
jgi:hypothetical protein